MQKIICKKFYANKPEDNTVIVLFKRVLQIFTLELNSYLLSSKPILRFDSGKVVFEGSRKILEKFFKNGNDKKRSRMVHHEAVCKSIQGKF